jgi:hypothetical protein
MTDDAAKFRGSAAACRDIMKRMLDLSGPRKAVDIGRGVGRAGSQSRGKVKVEEWLKLGCG